jgi:hypothetical protein
MHPRVGGGFSGLGRDGRRFRGAAVLAVALLALAILPGAASATPSHHYAGPVDPGVDPVYPSAPCHIWDLDVDVEENIYALCGGSTQGNNYGSGAVVKKFDKNGNPVPFTANEPYIQGNTLIEDPYPEAAENEFGKSFQNEGAIAVDTSSSATAGYIYIITGQHLDVLKPSGQYVGSLSPTGAFGIDSVATDPEGNVYYNSGFKIDKRDRSLTVIGQLYASAENSYASPGGLDMAFDSTGAVWGLGAASESFEYGTIARYEADQFGKPELESTFSLGTHRAAKLSKLVEAPLKAFGSEAELKGESIAVDRSDDSLFVQTATPFANPAHNHIDQFSRGTEAEPSHQIAAPIGDESNVGASPLVGESHGIAVGKGGTVFVAAGNVVSKFAPGGPLPTLRDHTVGLNDIGHTEATVRAKVELSGGGPITECEVVYGETREYGHSAPCAPNPSGSNFTSDTEISADLTGLTTGTEYHFAVVAGNAEGTGYGIDRSFSPAAVLHVNTLPPTELASGDATFNGSLDPDGMPTRYHFEYGLAGELTASTAASAPIESSGDLPVSEAVANLTPGQEYKYRLVATNSLGTSDGPVQSFTAAGAPAVSGVRAANIGSAEADLAGRVNPIGYPTTYFFEYGPTTDYGKAVPVPEGEAGEGSENVDVSEHVSGLEPGRVYHYRLVAKNRWGTTFSEDTSFNYLPEPCPNEHVRQQMKSSFLPDCRAYELVSPENAGGAQIYPGNEIYVADQGFPSFFQIGDIREIQNTGLANSPSRFAFYAGLGAVTGLDAPNVMLDQYTSTRTDEGWKTTFSGIQGSEWGGTGRKVCSITLDECLDHIRNDAFNPDPEYGPAEAPRNGGFLYNVEGKKIGTAPTNFESVENGKKFIGDIRMSPDFSHLAFSSRNAIFAEGGTKEEPGSVYDNDLETGTIKLISTLPGGDPIPAGGEGPYQFITIPPTGVSTDGSHILMETQSPETIASRQSEKGHRLYMSVNDAAAYEVSDGKGVKFIGMTPDGTKVLFLAEQQLTSEDTDHSADIYMWQENGGSPKLTLVTKDDGAGNSDACKASWTTDCSVQLLKTLNGDRSGFSEGTEPEMEYGNVTVGGIDSKFASESGGVFFFSPEDLAGTAPSNGKNLFFANDGEIHYVATVGANQAIDRIQISPDGAHAGFLTRARLTGYENEGYEEMYAYNVETGKLVCASCIPDGEPPTSDVEASQNGPFMSNDGRVFFSTADPLVPADADPYHIPDVYEYTGGRPQLISSGTSSNGKAPGGAAQFTTETLGLESVSSTGQDVFFSTTDSLVPQDANGNFAKIYDARTDGGFEVAGTPAPCVAADECHGTGSETPAPMQIGTGSSTSGGNVPAVKPAKKKSHKPKKSKKSKKHKRKNGKQAKKQGSLRERGGIR